MEIAQIGGTRVFAALLACERVGEVAAARVDDFALLLLGNLDTWFSVIRESKTDWDR